MFAEYGIPLPWLTMAIGHWVWLRHRQGPRLVQVLAAWDGRSALVDASDMVEPMTVPAERLTWTYAEAISA